MTDALVAVVLGGLLATAPVPTPIGTGPRYHPSAEAPAVAAGQTVAGLRCSPRARPRFGVHLELFANRLAVIVPAGIGIAPPLRRRGAYVLSGRCSYPARTRQPTGVIEVARDLHLSLGQLFAIWGQPLSRSRMIGFTSRGSPVLAFVDGRRWHGDPRRIPLHHHAQIVLELGGFIPPHASFLFPKGL